MKIWTIADTHTHHRLLTVPSDIDMVIFGGDMSIQKSPEMNTGEVLDFLDWFKNLPIRYKILIAGNHDTSIQNGLVSRSDIDNSIIYLEHEYVVIEGLKIFGSPYTPTFGREWAFNVPRDVIKKYWIDLATDIDILITHGPPKGILDLTQFDSRPGADGKSFFQCGCQELLYVVKEIQPKYHIFGHIHTELNCPNSGVLKIANCETTFINSAVCNFGKSDDKKVKELINNGHVFDF